MQKNMKLPFKVGKPVEEEYFIDRNKEIKELIRHIKSMSNTCLLGMRRMGKTSILFKIGREIEEPLPVYVNCYGIPDKKRFASLYLESIKDIYIARTGDGKYTSAIKKYIKKSTEYIAYQLTDMDVSVGQYFRIKVGVKQRDIDADTLLEDSINYAERLGENKGKRFVILLDEFQDIGSRWGDEFLKRFRSLVEKQKNVCYVFCGSSITFMRNLVEDAESPFYRQLSKVFVGPLPDREVKDFVKQRFELCGYSISDEVLHKFIKLTHSIPDYVQRLGSIASQISKKITERVVVDAYEKMLMELDSEFRETLSKLNQRSGIYGAILTGLSRYSSLSEAGRFIGYDLSRATRQIVYLQQVGLIEKLGYGKYTISDPILKDWLERNFS
jgi:AAA+ ATPase superfamily predicted ATPase